MSAVLECGVNGWSAACSYEEREAISVSEKLSQLDANEEKDLPHNDGDDSKPDVTSADSHAALSAESNTNKLLGT